MKPAGCHFRLDQRSSRLISSGRLGLQHADSLGFPVLSEHGTEQMIAGLGNLARHGSAATLWRRPIDVNAGLDGLRAAARLTRAGRVMEV